MNFVLITRSWFLGFFVCCLLWTVFLGILISQVNGWSYCSRRLSCMLKLDFDQHIAKILCSFMWLFVMVVRSSDRSLSILFWSSGFTLCTSRKTFLGLWSRWLDFGVISLRQCKLSVFKGYPWLSLFTLLVHQNNTSVRLSEA